MRLDFPLHGPVDGYRFVRTDQHADKTIDAFLCMLRRDLLLFPVDLKYVFAALKNTLPTQVASRIINPRWHIAPLTS